MREISVSRSRSSAVIGIDGQPPMSKLSTRPAPGERQYTEARAALAHERMHTARRVDPSPHLTTSFCGRALCAPRQIDHRRTENGPYASGNELVFPGQPANGLPPTAAGTLRSTVAKCGEAGRTRVCVIHTIFAIGA